MYQAVGIISSFLIVFIIQIPLLIIYNLIRKRKVTADLNYIAITAYSVVIIQLTLWPLVMGQPAISWAEISYNIVPFDSILGSLKHTYYLVGIRNVFGNIVLLLPLAIFINFKSWKRATIVGFCISLGIEILQVILTRYGLIHIRTFDVDDLLLNTLGFLIGYLINIRIKSLTNVQYYSK